VIARGEAVVRREYTCTGSGQFLVIASKGPGRAIDIQQGVNHVSILSDGCSILSSPLSSWSSSV